MMFPCIITILNNNKVANATEKILKLFRKHKFGGAGVDLINLLTLYCNV